MERNARWAGEDNFSHPLLNKEIAICYSIKALFNNWKALGSPLAWTTNDTHNPYFSTLNYDTGDHAWVIDMDMNCAESDDGWFEFKTIYSYGGKKDGPLIVHFPFLNFTARSLRSERSKDLLLYCCICRDFFVEIFIVFACD